MTKIEYANTVPNTAKLLNVSASTVRREIRVGSIPHLKIRMALVLPIKPINAKGHVWKMKTIKVTIKDWKK